MTEPKHPRRRHAGVTATGIVTALIGLAFLAWQVAHVGSRDVLDGLRQVGAGFLLVLAIAFARLVIRAYAWSLFFDRRASLSHVIAATLVGDAAGGVTPLSLLVSEPAKALYLRDDIPPSRGLAAAAAENFFYSLSVALVIIAGMTALLLGFPLPQPVRLASWIALVAMLAVVAAGLWLIWRRPSLVSSALAALPFAAARRAVERVRTLEETAYAFVRQTGHRLAAVIACEIAFHLLSLAETYVTLWLVAGRATVTAAFILDSVSRVINVVFRVVPLRIGVDEEGARLVADVLGYTQANGLAMALVRRGRLIVWTLPGLVLLVRRGLSMKKLIRDAK